MFQSRVNPDLFDARTHIRHRLPIVRVEALLHPIQLEPSDLTSIGRKGLNIPPRRSEPLNRLD